VDARRPDTSSGLLRRTLVDSRGRGNPSEKRKVDSSILSLTTTTHGVIPSALTSANAYPNFLCLQLSSDPGCSCVTVVRRPLSHADRTPCPAQIPPPNPTAAEPDGGRVLSRVGVADHAGDAGGALDRFRLA
jgi:hypothetical protein